MEIQKMNAGMRTTTGKGPARRLRQAGKIPAVLYGRGIDPVPLTIVPAQIRAALSGPHRENTVLSLNIENASGKVPRECSVLVRDHQYDPLSLELKHVDFLLVDLDTPTRFKVPLVLTGQSKGVKAGGTMSVFARKLPVECLPADTPAELTVDITELDLLDTLSVKDLEIPENVKVLLDEERTIASVLAKRVEVEETEEEGEEGAEGAEGAEGEKKDEEKSEDAS
jgi:large subunit ribosomal protein L25